MRTVVLLITLLMGSYAVRPVEAACCVDVAVKMTVQKGTDGPILQASLENRGRTAFEINSSLLPWGGRYSLILVAVQERMPNKQLSQIFFIDDIGPETIELQAGGKAEGRIDLREFFEDLQPELKKGSLILLWSYKLVTVDGSESNRFTGSVRIPGGQ